MTANVGVARNGRVWMGADTLASSSTLATSAQEKVWVRDNIAFGVSGWVRGMNLLRYALAVPALAPGGDVLRWATCDLVDSIRACLKAGGHSDAENDKESTGGNYMLVGVRGLLFSVASDYGVTMPVGGVDTNGSGHAVALGAVHALLGVGREPADAIRGALEIAAEFAPHIRPPFTMVCTEAE